MIRPSLCHLGGRRQLVNVTGSPCLRAQPLPCVPVAAAVRGERGREEAADNGSPLAEPVIVIYGRIVLICMKWLLLRLLLLELDFEKKKLFCLRTADFILRIVLCGRVSQYLKHPTAFLPQIK